MKKKIIKRKFTKIRNFLKSFNKLEFNPPHQYILKINIQYKKKL